MVKLFSLDAQILLRGFPLRINRNYFISQEDEKFLADMFLQLTDEDTLEDRRKQLVCVVISHICCCGKIKYNNNYYCCQHYQVTHNDENVVNALPPSQLVYMSDFLLFQKAVSVVYCHAKKRKGPKIFSFSWTLGTTLPLLLVFQRGLFIPKRQCKVMVVTLGLEITTDTVTRVTMFFSLQLKKIVLVLKS